MGLPPLDPNEVVEYHKTKHPAAPRPDAATLFALVQGLTGVSIDDIIDSLPKGSTPNRYKPHQGKREMERRARKMKGQQA